MCSILLQTLHVYAVYRYSQSEKLFIYKKIFIYYQKNPSNSKILILMKVYTIWFQERLNIEYFTYLIII